MTLSEAWQTVGPHRYRHQDNVLIFEPVGEISLSQAQAWCDVIFAHFQRHPSGFLLVGASALSPPSAQVRRLFATRLQAHTSPPRIFIFGANLVTRTISRLVISAARQLYNLHIDLMQFATEADAWARIEELRRPQL